MLCICLFLSLSHAYSFATLWTVAHQGPLSMGFSRQEYWSDLLFPSLGDLPDPGIEPTSLASPALASGFFASGTTWEAPLTTGIPEKSLNLYVNYLVPTTPFTYILMILCFLKKNFKALHFSVV